MADKHEDNAKFTLDKISHLIGAKCGDGWCAGKLSTNVPKVKDRDDLKMEIKASKE